METDARDVVGVAFELEDGVRVRRLDIVELNGGMTSSGEEALVGGDAETIYLGV